MDARPPVPVPDYPSNSMTSKIKDDNKKTTPVASGKIVKRKKTAKEFINEHSDEVKSYILYDIIAPAVKDMLAAIANSAVFAIKDVVETSLYGAPRGGYSRKQPQYDYSKRYSSSYPAPKMRVIDNVSYNRGTYTAAKAKQQFNDIAFNSRGEAETVLDKLLGIISQYDEASVGDFYDLAGVSSDFTDRKWGWKNLSQAYVSREKDGYMIYLPDPQPL